MQRMPKRVDYARLPSLKTHLLPRYDSLTTKMPLNGMPTSDPANILVGSPDLLVNTPQVQTPEAAPERSHSDIFETQDEEEPNKPLDGIQEEATSNDFDELPIEIQSLIERFLESLSLKSSSAVLSIERLAELYQDFYVHVESHISTHVAALSTRIAREKSPAPSVSSTGSTASNRGGRRGTKDRPSMRKHESEQQMLTASEVFDRRKARRQLELKKIAMEEAVEREVCERVYPRLWRHSSTDDESRDAKLRSRAAALSVVGVDLNELLSTAQTSEGGSASDASVTQDARKDSVKEKLEEACKNLEQMNDGRYPQAKLQYLSTVHQNIVESLSQLFPSSSSADEIFPTLIYVLIISSPESLSVVSNLLFVQRFRNQAKIDGEAAYCLTNLEAAMSFLETVDLSSIRRDELPEGPQKNSHPDSGSSTPRMEPANPLYRGLPLSPPQPSSQPSKSPSHSRRLSSLLSSKPSKPLEAASEAVDSAYDAMHNALDGSFKFFFGRMREKQATQSPVTNAAVPKTLEDARKLVSQEEKSNLGDEDDSASLGELVAKGEVSNPAKGEDTSARVLELVGGKKAREQSTPSVRNADGGKKVAFINGTSESVKPDNASVTSQTSSGSGSVGTAQSNTPGYNNAVEQMRNLGNSLNPLNYRAFSMRGFGRNVTPSVLPPTMNQQTNADVTRPAQFDNTAHPVSGTGSEQATAVSSIGVGPPIQRFLELKEAKELNGFDVELLLRDYQRLAGALKALEA